MGRSLGCDTCHRSGKTGIDLAKTGPYPKQTRMSTVATINRLPAFSPSGKIEARLRFKVCWALGQLDFPPLPLRQCTSLNLHTLAPTFTNTLYFLPIFSHTRAFCFSHCRKWGTMMIAIDNPKRERYRLRPHQLVKGAKLLSQTLSNQLGSNM